ncbi:MAG: alcohol dehydrogenase catalytic domain-containing protein [Desulfobacteraceae bacterium]|jgi:L-iditol 2-dehydrogenase
MQTNCILVPEIGRFAWTQKEIPQPKDDEVMIQVEITGLCRTDLKIIRHGHRDLVLPRVPGEEVVGRIVSAGSSVTGFEKDDRVYVYPGIWCGACDACAKGAQNLCREMQIMGFHRDGGFAEYVIAPAQSLIRLPDTLSADTAVLAEPLSCCLNALELGRVKAGHRVGIWGAGPAGLLLARASRALGADPTNIEPDERRRAFADGIHQCTDQRFDVCIVAVGSSRAYQEALAHMAPRGVLVVFSGLLPADDPIPLSLNQLHYHEQTLVGAYGCAYRHGVHALDWLADRTIHVEDMISHRMPLSSLDDALQLVENRESIKILLYPS